MAGRRAARADIRTSPATLSELVGPGLPSSWSCTRRAGRRPGWRTVTATWPAWPGGAGRCRRRWPPPACGAAVVLDVGHSGTEVTRLAADGAVLSCLTGPVGGARLDEAVLGWLRSRGDGPGQPTATGADHGAPVATAVRGPAGAGTSSELAEAQRIRERLSLLPAAETALPDLGRPVCIRAPDLDTVLAGPLGAAVDLLGAVGAGAGAAPVLLIGGVARAPLLAELLDAAGRADVAVAARPDAAAVLGALRPAPNAVAVPGGRAPPGAAADSSTGGSARPGPATRRTRRRPGGRTSRRRDGDRSGGAGRPGARPRWRCCCSRSASRFFPPSDSGRPAGRCPRRSTATGSTSRPAGSTPAGCRSAGGCC